MTETETETDPTESPNPLEESTDESDRDVSTYLTYGALGLLTLLALIATFRFYTNASRAISLWVAPEYEPMVQAAFNFAVVLLSAAGVSMLVRRLR
ncbi:hypothetical protein BRC83_07970 [Halobacteriales archaeon QS_1_68_17]|nr:MAG: hypothetical protein BRC83_07970 [Halobacteriales archaeon QS_1_68_17]